MKTINRIFLLLATFCAAVACSDDDTELTIYSLKFEPGSINLGVGESRRLVPISDPPVDGIQYEWKSVDERIATVDAAGLVTGVSAGSTEIRAFYGDNRMARCLVSAVENTSSLPDPTPALAADLSQELIFSSNQLAYKGTVMQCFDFYDENGYIYYTQCAADSQTGNRWLVVLGRQKRNEAPSGDYMRLQWFGHGTLVVAEKAEDGDYVWVASNGTISGSDYTNNLTFSRIKYQKGAVLSHYGGDTFYLSRYVDAAGTAWDVRDVQPAVDFVNRRLLIGCRTNDMRHNVVYDLDDVLALENEQVEVTRTWGGELAAEGQTTQQTETTTLQARNLNRLTPLGSFRLPSYLDTGQTDQPYSYSHQGHAIWGDYVYWYEGNAIQKSGELYDGSIAYVAVFDYTGKQVCPRTRVAACSDFPNMSTLLDSKDCYCEGEGIQIKQGSKFYVGIATHTSAASSNRLATILQYECAVK